ncbi:hypothetical protein LR48_Vigan11g136500 [Vigna angularis]|uniref:CI111 double-psi beta barrel domain-containing protein n=1 Tax=Phaseolus angularis TaxID=3914 RepID=A0A0L9VTB7_PHAAN|nr:hypothetical protein LR48_Vigan11g136500 [Vigna angularis]
MVEAAATAATTTKGSPSDGSGAADLERWMKMKTQRGRMAEAAAVVWRQRRSSGLCTRMGRMGEHRGEGRAPRKKKLFECENEKGSATHLEAIDAEIAVILDEARTSYATHNRKLISLLRAKSSSSVFFSAFSRTLTPLIDFQRRLASVERVVSFVYALAASASDEFLDCFLKFLLAAATTYNKTSRFRACQIVFEVIEWMMVRVRDKIPVVRSFPLMSLANECAKCHGLKIAKAVDDDDEVGNYFVLAMVFLASKFPNASGLSSPQFEDSASSVPNQKSQSLISSYVNLAMTIDEVKHTAQQQMNRALKDHARLYSLQALADYATLIIDLKKNLSATDSPVVVFGGSYGGMLAAWFRMKYPHVAIGALASSAPILQFMDLVSPDIFNSIISQDFRSESENCYKVLKGSWKLIEQTANKPEGLELLQKSFRICKSNDFGAGSLEGWLRTAWVYTAMTDYPTPSNFLNPLPAYPIKKVPFTFF